MPLGDLCWIAVEVLWLHASKLLLEDEDTRTRVNANILQSYHHSMSTICTVLVLLDHGHEYVLTISRML